MSPRDRRASRRPGGRGPAILRFEPLEGRTLLSGDPTDILSGALAGATVTTTTTTDVAPDAPTARGTIDASPGQVAPTDPAAATDANDLVRTIAAPADATPPTVAPTATNTVLTTTAAAAGARPNLVSTRFSAPGNLDWDELFQATGTIANEGNAATAAPFKVDIYASADVKGGASAVPVGSFMVPAGLAPGASHEFDVSLRTPGRPPASLTQNPSYYLTLAVDTTNTIAESNEADNGARGFQGADASVVTITPRLPSRLVAAGLSVPQTPMDWGGTMRVTATVRNEGEGSAPPTNARIVLAPFGDDPFGPRGYTIGSVPLPEVPPRQTVSATQNIRLPQFPPSVLANVGQFVVMMVSDADALADPVLKPIDYQGPGLDWTTARINPKTTPVTTAQQPDLAVTSLTTPAAMTWDQQVEIKAKLENPGQADAGPFKVRFALVQSDDPTAPALNLGDVTVAGLQAGAVQDIVQTIKLPARVPDGLNPYAPAARIIARVDPDRTLDESRLDNNKLASPPITLRLLTPDVPTDPTPAPADTTTTAPPVPTGSGNPTPAPTTPTNPSPNAPPGGLQNQTPQDPPQTQTPPPTIPINQPSPRTPPALAQNLRAQRAQAREAALAARRAAMEARQAMLAARRAAIAARRAQIHVIPIRPNALRNTPNRSA
jgi:hypothetical protein